MAKLVLRTLVTKSTFLVASHHIITNISANVNHGHRYDTTNIRARTSK